MFSKYIAALTLLALTTQAAWQNGTYIPPSNCELAASDDAANATGSTPIAGVRVDKSTGNITSDPSSNWSFGASLTEYTNSSSNEPNLEFWLDSSATVGTNDTVLPYNSCVVVLVGAPQRNNADACLSKSCVDALTKQYQSGAQQIAIQMHQSNTASVDAQEGCHDLITLIAPDECKGFTPASASKNRASWGSSISTSPSSLNPIPASNCTPSRPTAPLPLFGAIYGPDTPTNFSAYDRAVSSSIPFVIALWSNSTTRAAMGVRDAGAPWADARVGCVRPSTVRAGSRVPPSSGSGGKISPSRQSAIWGVASLAVLMTSKALF